jgi:hypothetical protein
MEFSSSHVTIKKSSLFAIKYICIPSSKDSVLPQRIIHSLGWPEELIEREKIGIFYESTAIDGF